MKQTTNVCLPITFSQTILTKINDFVTPWGSNYTLGSLSAINVFFRYQQQLEVKSSPSWSLVHLFGQQKLVQNAKW